AGRTGTGHDAAADDGARPGASRLRVEPRQPVGLGLAVVVDDRHPLAAREPPSGVQRAAAPRLARTDAYDGRDLLSALRKGRAGHADFVRSDRREALSGATVEHGRRTGMTRRGTRSALDENGSPRAWFGTRPLARG